METTTITEYGKMTVVQLRAAAKAVGLKGAGKLQKGDLLNAILAAEAEQRKESLAEAKVDQVLRSDPIDAKLGAFDAPAPAPESPAPKTQAAPPAQTYVAVLEPKGTAKARRFQEVAEKHGWAVEISAPVAGNTVALVATRGLEAIHLEWDLGVFIYESCTYVIADRVTKPRNASGARRVAERSAAEAAAELGRVVGNKSFKRKTVKDGAPKQYALPFDPAEATEAGLKAAMAGKKVSWVNGITLAKETATVSPNGHFFKVQSVAGERVVQFLDPRTGFRALRLSSLLSVGRK